MLNNKPFILFLIGVGLCMIGFVLNYIHFINRNKGLDLNNREYQIELTKIDAQIYDGNRLVGIVPYNQDTISIEDVLLGDNL